MSLSNPLPYRRTLGFRLTLLYTALGGCTLLVVLLVSYLLLRGFLQRQLDAELMAEVVEYGALLETQPLAVMQDVLDQEVASEGTDRMFFRLFNHAGSLIMTTDTRAWPSLEVHRPSLLAAASGKTVFQHVPQAGVPHPTRVIYASAVPDAVFQIGYTTADYHEILIRLQQVFVLAALAFLLCSILAGNWLARSALGGVNRVAQTAQAISGGDWSRRVDISPRQDEIDRLAQAFNEMVDRIERLIKELREVTDDIAHDLRTPITRMHMAAEAVLRGSREISSENLAEEMEMECAHLLALINKMLDISQTEAGLKLFEPISTDLSQLAGDVCELFQPAAEDKQVSLSMEQMEPAPCLGDPQALSRAIAQLLDNAIKYTPPGGTIAICCASTQAASTLAIQDSGVGISEQDREKVFARFYRGDPSRATSGSGLGLSLARAIVRAHNGDLRFDSAPGKGATFYLSLPRA